MIHYKIDKIDKNILNINEQNEFYKRCYQHLGIG